MKTPNAFVVLRQLRRDYENWSLSKRLSGYDCYIYDDENGNIAFGFGEDEIMTRAILKAMASVKEPKGAGK